MMEHLEPGAVVRTATCLLVLLHSSLTAQPIFPPGTCGPIDVSAGAPLSYVTLEDTLSLYVKPKDTMIYIRMMVAGTLYKTTVDGTMMELLICDDQETNCTTIDEGGSKSSNLIMPGRWNKITVTHANNKISVDVNMEADIMGMAMPKMSGQAVKSEVAIVNVDPGAKTWQSPDYSATVRVVCNDTHPPSIRQVPALPLPSTTVAPVIPAPAGTCEEIDVRAGARLSYVTLEDTLSLYIQPTDEMLHIRMMVEGTLYKATVDGTMMELLICDDPETNCTTIDEGGSKSSNLIMPGRWNKITLTHANNKISVDVNMKADVMGMAMPKMSGQAVKSEVAIVNVDPGAKTWQSPDYSVTVRVVCNDTHPPSIREAPALPLPSITTTTTPTFPVYPAPYKGCQFTQVEADHAFTVHAPDGNLTLAVFPSSPSLYLHITLAQQVYQLSISGRKMELERCDLQGQNCDMADSNNSNSDFLQTDQWNDIVIIVSEPRVTITVNTVYQTTSQHSIGGTSFASVTILPAVPLGPVDHYTVAVNVKCEVPYVPEQFTLGPFTTTATGTNTTIAPGAVTRTVSKTISIIVGVLLAILAVAIIIFVVKSYSSRRSATINQHTPLNEQQREQ